MEVNKIFNDLIEGEKYYFISTEAVEQKGNLKDGFYYVNNVSKDKKMITVTKNNTDVFLVENLPICS